MSVRAADPVVGAEAVGERAPLSHQQEQLWLVERAEPESALYNEQLTLELRGPLDEAALERALADVIARHDVLRVAYQVADDGEPVQVVLPVIDVSTTPPVEVAGDREAALEHAREIAAAPYDLVRGPLVRARLVRVEAATHVLVFAFHHSVFDGLSVDILLDELRCAYAARCLGRTPSLPPVARSYLDYARWQRHALVDGALDESLGYWSRALDGAPTIIEVPGDRPRRPGGRSAARYRLFRLDPALTPQVDALARGCGCTPFTVLLAAFAALLYRFTAREDLIVGTGAPGRPGRGYARTIGLFTNILPLRLRPSGPQPFAELAAAAAEATFEALDHQYVPFEVLVQRHAQRDPAFRPLVQLMFVARGSHTAAFELGDVTARILDVPRAKARFDVVVEATLATDAVELFVEYDSTLYDDDTIDLLCRLYERVLAAACRDPRVPLARIPLLTPGEEAALTAGGSVVRDRDGNVAPPLVYGLLDGEPRLVARRLRDGSLAVAGPESRRVRLGVLTVQLDDVEAALSADRNVTSVAVAVVDGKLVADVEVHDSSHDALAAVEARLTRELPRTMLPTLAVRGAAPAAAAADPKQQALESVLCELWAEVMALPAVARDDDFFELGGHSIVAARLAERMRARLGVPVPLVTVFEFPSVAELAEELCRLNPGLEVAAEAVSEAGGAVAESPLEHDLSLAQLQVWIAEQLSGGALEDYLAAVAYTIDGPLDVGALERAFAAVVGRHDALRSTFHDSGTTPVVRITPSVELELELVDVGAGTLRETLLQAARRPFDLTRGPLIRASLFRETPTRATLLVGIHHLVVDGASMPVLLHDLSELYRAAVTGRRPELVPPSRPYAHYVEWEREWIESAEAEETMRATVAQLAAIPELRLGGAATSRGTPRSSSRSVRCPPGTGEAVRRLARSLRTSPFAVATAAFSAALAATAAQDEFAIGTVVETRPGTAFDGTVGCFANLVALRADVSGKPTFGALVERIRESVRLAYAARHLPFAEVARRVGAPPDLPLFQVASEWLPLEQIALRLTGCEVSHELLPRRTSRLDLVFYAAEEADGLTLEAEFAVAALGPDDVEGLLGKARSMLVQGAQDPATPVSRLVGGMGLPATR